MEDLDAWVESLPSEQQKDARQMVEWQRDLLEGLSPESRQRTLRRFGYTLARLAAIEQVVKSDCAVSEGMARIVEFSSRGRPHPDWQRVLALDIEGDLERLKGWLESMFVAEPPPASVTGLWFGLFSPIREGRASTDLHLSGSPYDPEDADWASRVAWAPSASEARSQVLDEISQIVEPALAVYEADYALGLAYGGLAVRWLATDIDRSVLLAGADERVLFVGFDAGDRLCIGKVDARGLRFSRDREHMA